MVVKAVSYEVTDPTVDSQVVTLQASGADVLITAATPKFAAQTIRKVYDIGWKPLHFMTNVSISVGAVLSPAGPEKAVGMITGAYLKDPTDPHWKDDAGMNEWRGFMAKYMPGADLTDANYVYAYGVSDDHDAGAEAVRQRSLAREHHEAGGQPARPRAADAAARHQGRTPVATNYHPIRAMQLQKWNGKSWELFGDVIAAS